MFKNIKKRMFILILISLSIFLGYLGTITVMAEKNKTEMKQETIQNGYKKDNNIVKDSLVISKRDNLSNYKISKEKGLEIIKSKVKLEPGLHILYDSERNIKGENYHLYTLNTNEYTYDEYAYCVDVNSGELFKCFKDFTLFLIK
ncbi:hypothetical protein LGK95_21335 [Clostridium algoriphilum]|uniref:hypothetical protein n=1 Tax=Clostridium algoriphilum TaxID=198347 RepID=UPI001CF3B791|nr:hypothetical protein [Clostridium algoriphilum]MCB2295999.1 hypothetical protein [Clostridium algoriphilum]